MKNRKYNVLLGIAVAGAMLLAACGDTFNMPKQPSVEAGYGRISINVTGGARTALPTVGEYDKYVYTFTKKGAEEGTVLAPDSLGVFTVELGVYTVTVDAYIGNGEDPEEYTRVATGVSDEFEVKAGVNQPVNVGLDSVAVSGTGSFTYTVNYPATATAVVILRKYLAEEDVLLEAEPTDEDGVATLTETLAALDVGSYLLTINVTDGDTYAGIVEAVHIYPDTETEFTKVFEAVDLIVPPPVYTVTFDKNHDDAAGFTEAIPAIKTVQLPATTVDSLPAVLPTRTGFNFDGWNTQADGLGAAFTAATRYL